MAKKNDFLRDFISEIGDENTSIAADGMSAGEFSGFVDTGSYALNAVLSGSIYGGIADNKVTGFAGESSTGKCARGSQKIEVYFESKNEAIKWGFE